MLAIERQDFVREAIAVVDSVLREQGGIEDTTSYTSALNARLYALMQSIDRIVFETNQRPGLQAPIPVVFTDIVPGYDLVVLPGAGVDAPEDLVIAQPVISRVDATSLRILGSILDRLDLGEDSQLFAARDGFHYVVYRESVRATMLASMGIDASSLLPGERVLQGGMLQ